MKRYFVIGSTLISSFLCIVSCRKNYAPPAVKTDYKYLVVNGQIINSIDSPTVIILSRTVRLTDSTFSNSPETGATILVQSNTGESYPLQETSQGVYLSLPLALDYSKQYRINITTSNGKNYISDYVSLTQTPAIDSVTWQQDNDATIYVNTHGNANDTKYYRWDYTETWQYRAPLNRSIADSNGILYYVDSTTQTYNCWRSNFSNNILVATTEALGKNVIVSQKLTTIPQNDEKLAVRYSILVKQYGLTKDAFEYLSVLQKNNESLGSVFDAQPTQLSGNIHCTSNPGEIVIGYISASSVTQQRIFIDPIQLHDWMYVYSGESCNLIEIPQDQNNFRIYSFGDISYAPYYFVSSPPDIKLAKRSCVDCRTNGGTTVKPSFW